MILYIPKSIESFIAAIDSKDWCSSVGFSHSSISLKYDDFGPYLIINTFPFSKHFFDVVLEKKKIIKINKLLSNNKLQHHWNFIQKKGDKISGFMMMENSI